MNKSVNGSNVDQSEQYYIMLDTVYRPVYKSYSAVTMTFSVIPKPASV